MCCPEPPNFRSYFLIFSKKLISIISALPKCLTFKDLELWPILTFKFSGPFPPLPSPAQFYLRDVQRKEIRELSLHPPRAHLQGLPRFLSFMVPLCIYIRIYTHIYVVCRYICILYYVFFRSFSKVPETRFVGFFFSDFLFFFSHFPVLNFFPSPLKIGTWYIQ